MDVSADLVEPVAASLDVDEAARAHTGAHDEVVRRKRADSVHPVSPSAHAPPVAPGGPRRSARGLRPPCPTRPRAGTRGLVVLDVADDSLAVRLCPLDDGVQPRVHVPDGLVAEIEEIGVEERQVVVGRVGSGHVRADIAAVCRRMVLVLDSPEPAERRGKPRHVARGEHVVPPFDPSVLVHEHAVVERKPRFLGKVGSRFDAEPGDDDVSIDRPSVDGDDPQTRVARPSDLCNLLSGQDVDALRAVVLVDERRELRRKNPRADARVRETMVTAQSFMASAAQISDPMKPPPMTVTRTSPASARSRWYVSSVR